LLFIVIRKIINNKGLIAALLAGSILAVAMISSIPMYTDAILQRMLTKEFETSQEETGNFPGKYLYSMNSVNYYKSSKRYWTYEYFTPLIQEHMEDLGVAWSQKVLAVQTRYIRMTSVNQDRQGGADHATINLISFTDYADHIKLTSGSMPSSTLGEDGVMEVVVQESLLALYDLLLGDVLQVNTTITGETHEPFYVKIVGVYTVEDADEWWFLSPNEYRNMMLMDFDLYMAEIAGTQNMLTDISWYYALDYSTFRIDSINAYVEQIKAEDTWFSGQQGATFYFGALDTLENYVQKEKTLRTTLWVLQVPIIIMLAFYIFMVSQMVVTNDSNEIAVYKSRGASGIQVFLLYVVQSCLLAVVAFLLGPLLAYGICTVLGSSNGFMEFVGRKALPLSIHLRVLLYAAGAAFFTIVMMMVPAMGAARITIVEHKQKKARQWNAPFWQKCFLDFIFLGLALYGLYSYGLREETVQLTELAGASTAESPVDPFLFLISTLFIMGAGLFFLRIYPWIIKGIFWLGRKRWNPVMYTSFITVSRSTGRQTFVMLFLILALSVGVFSANAARTINGNIEDRIHYAVGSDMVMELYWPRSTAVDYSESSGANSSAAPTVINAYAEPPFETVTNIPGVEAAARVLQPSGVRVRTEGNYYVSTRLMCIRPSEFGQVVWTGGDILSHHIYEYLNIMSEEPRAVVVSSNAKQFYNVGDTIRYSWGGNLELEGVIFAFVDYWPGINPNDGVDYKALQAIGSEDDSAFFVIANYDYVSSFIMTEPYQYWIKRDTSVSTEEMYNYIAENKIQLSTTFDYTEAYQYMMKNSVIQKIGAGAITDASQQLVLQKNDAMLQGTNGALTLGFLVTIAIAMIGFFIYWVLSIRSRELQFGILRAIGMTKKKIIEILIAEQVMVSLVASLAGVIIGSLTSQLYVPMLSMVYSSTEQVPAFRVIMSQGDYVKIYVVIALMLLLGFAVLGWLTSRIKIAQAIKLGED